MEARLANELPTTDGPWQYEPKWDGFRCLAFKIGKKVELRAKSGKSLNRYFPEVVDYIAQLDAKDFLLDGELVIESGRRLDFEALQTRLHPAASRILRLSLETPARFMVFDLLVAPDGKNLLSEPLSERRKALVAFMKTHGSLDVVLSRATKDSATAQKWLLKTGADGTDGVVAKRLTEPYEPGERGMVKVKRLRTADCVVGGFRYESDSTLVGSLLLGLYNDKGLLDHVGFTSALSDAEKPTLTKKLEKLAGGEGFTGKKPGSPSRWSTKRSNKWTPLKPKLVVEVRYDHITGDRFRHGTTLLRWRPDKRPTQCTFEQVT
jgi:ATP-dependent DNA ligase